VRQTFSGEWNPEELKNHYDSAEDVVGSSKGHFSDIRKTEKRNETVCTETPEEEEEIVSFKGLKSNFLRTKTSMISKGQTGPSVNGTGDLRVSSVPAFFTGFNWARASGATWIEAKSNQISFKVPAGLRIRIYQVVGYCANFQVRPNILKKVADIAE